MPPSMAQTWTRWEKSAQRGTYPFDFAPYEDAKRVMDKVVPLFDADREAFTNEFLAAAEPHEKRAREAEARGDKQAARKEYLSAYGLYRMARFPCQSTQGKKAAYKKSQDCVLKAWSFDEVPARRVEMPFKGRPGEGDKMIGYLRAPKGVARPPVLVYWAGIDTFKEDCLHRTLPFFARGIACLMIDMPGTGDSPILGSEDGERQWDAVFDWIAAQPDLDSSRVGAYGGSFGGYWATKVAHNHRDRLKGVISQGGGAHLVFAREQIERAQNGGIPWGQSETRGHAFGRPSHAQWLEYAPRLSLLDQGVLDKPCAPLLCINGVKDPITPIADYYLVLEHGSPKEARFFANGGHMGTPLDHGPDETIGIMTGWLAHKLGVR